MKSMCLYINPKSKIDLAWKELEELGVQILYSEENEGEKVIYGNVGENVDLSNNKHIVALAPFTLPETDWYEQFQDHGMNFHDGMVHVDLKDFAVLNALYNPIKLTPGPGFGDLSHPTTSLCLKLMSGLLVKRDVLDIGSGSGILSLAAVSMGAKSCFGIDIDRGAIEHSRSNAELNGMEGLVSFGIASDYCGASDDKNIFVLMNMIQSEQLQAWESVKSIHDGVKDCIVSGILKTGRKQYLKWAQSQEWELVSEMEENGWLAFHFRRT